MPHALPEENQTKVTKVVQLVTQTGGKSPSKKDDEVVVVVEVNIFEAEGSEAVASFIKPQIPLVT